jgi:hypothetical protein
MIWPWQHDMIQAFKHVSPAGAEKIEDYFCLRTINQTTAAIGAGSVVREASLSAFISIIRIMKRFDLKRVCLKYQRSGHSVLDAHAARGTGYWDPFSCVVVHRVRRVGIASKETKDTTLALSCGSTGSRGGYLKWDDGYVVDAREALMCNSPRRLSEMRLHYGAIITRYTQTDNGHGPRCPRT